MYLAQSTVVFIQSRGVALGPLKLGVRMESVVWPLGRSVLSGVSGRRHVDTLEGKTVAFIWDDLFQGDRMFSAFADAARDRGQEFKVVPHQVFGDLHGHDEHEVVRLIPERLREHGVDVAIVGVGACGSCTPAVIRACEAVEKAGIPALALVSSGFIRQARATARSVGLDHVWIAEYPGVIPNDSDQTFNEKVRAHVVPSLFDGFAELSRGFEVDAQSGDSDPAPRDIVFTGTFDEVQDYFDDRLWSDGLPVVPPTVERVEQFLRFTDRDPDEVIGVLLPAMREVTVWSVAVNGVMAGCRPEYLPVLLAIAEIIADPAWRLEDAGATPGWEPLVLVSGPLAKLLDFNYEGGMMRVGRRANSSVGRFTRLIMRNLAGSLTHPGDTDKAAIGRTFNVAMAENDDLTLDIGWQPSRVEAGFSLEDSVVSVQSVVGISGPAYTGGSSADQLAMLTEYTKDTLGPWSFTNINYRISTTLVLMSPSVAASLAADGLTKDDVREYLAKNTLLEAGILEAEARMTRGNEFSLADLVARGIAPALYHESDDPSRLVPVIPDPTTIRIVLGGDPGRNQNRVYGNNHEQGLALHRKVELNASMRALSPRVHVAQA
jgi:hypothetical protein